jgi:hypothetical protein
MVDERRFSRLPEPEREGGGEKRRGEGEREQSAAAQRTQLAEKAIGVSVVRISTRLTRDV